jgi:hypothetical protein
VTRLDDVNPVGPSASTVLGCTRPATAAIGEPPLPQPDNNNDKQTSPHA